MSSTITRRWERFERSSDAYLAVVVMLLILIVVPILTVGSETFQRISTAAVVGLTVTLSMAASKAHRWAIRASWIASLMIVAAIVFPESPKELAVVSGIALGILMIATPFVIIRRIARHETITATTMWGAIAAYLAVGMAFSLMYAAVYAADPSSFPAISDGRLGDFNYFSYVTMTTLGYGDIAPASELTRAMAVVHTLVGQIFLVVVVARVVSLLGRARYRDPIPKGPLDVETTARGDENRGKGNRSADEGGE